MSEQPPKETQPWMDRPLRSLLDIRIGTVVKAYLIYLAIGLVVFLIGVAIIVGIWNRHSSDSRLGGSSVLEWSSTAGDTISDAQYESIHRGSSLASVRSQLGSPASTGPNPLDLVTGAKQKCLGYRSSTKEGRLFVLCFARGRLVQKETW